jgi:hypothetical protein
MDNAATQAPQDNGSTQMQGSTGSEVGAVATPSTTSQGWKAGIREDLRSSPLLQKFEDNPQGLEKAIESHANLEKLLGHEKVPIPKDVNDVEGWNRFSKAMGIPDKAEGYGLPDVDASNYPGLEFNKNEFAEIAHSLKLTPAQAKGLWESYTSRTMESYQNSMAEHKKNLEGTVTKLKSEWGDAFQQNVELGQMVINKFSADQEMNDYLTTVMTQDPRGIKFLAKIGDQFAENKVGEFGIKRFTLAPEQAREEISKIVRDPNHPYNSPKATDREHQAAVDYVNSLYATANR